MSCTTYLFIITGDAGVVESLIVRARAPLRISFGGGGTDVPPYPEKYGGVVLSTTIDRYAYCVACSREMVGYSLKSLDLEMSEIYPDLESLRYDGSLDIAKAVIKTVCGENDEKLDLSILSEAPPGSGLGSSSAIMVAIIKAVSDFVGRESSSYQTAELAFQLERMELGIKGGYQDQYASTFGGFNFMEFEEGNVVVNPLRIRDEILHELLASLILIDTGRSRLSSNILTRQIESYEREEADVMDSLKMIKNVALEMKSSLLKGNITRFGELLGEEWAFKKRLDKMVTNYSIDALYKTALEKGATGGKVLGAGDGGHMLFFVDLTKKRDLSKWFVSNGHNPISFNFDNEGVVSWKMGNDGRVVV